jgi:hypothetical protein
LRLRQSRGRKRLLLTSYAPLPLPCAG